MIPGPSSFTAPSQGMAPQMRHEPGGSPQVDLFSSSAYPPPVPRRGEVSFAEAARTTPMPQQGTTQPMRQTSQQMAELERHLEAARHLREQQSQWPQAPTSQQMAELEQQMAAARHLREQQSQWFAAQQQQFSAQSSSSGTLASHSYRPHPQNPGQTQARGPAQRRFFAG